MHWHRGTVGGPTRANTWAFVCGYVSVSTCVCLHVQSAVRLQRVMHGVKVLNGFSSFQYQIHTCARAHTHADARTSTYSADQGVRGDLRAYEWTSNARCAQVDVKMIVCTRALDAAQTCGNDEGFLFCVYADYNETLAHNNKCNSSSNAHTRTCVFVHICVCVCAAAHAISSR